MIYNEIRSNKCVQSFSSTTGKHLGNTEIQVRPPRPILSTVKISGFSEVIMLDVSIANRWWGAATISNFSLTFS